MLKLIVFYDVTVERYFAIDIHNSIQIIDGFNHLLTNLILILL